MKDKIFIFFVLCILLIYPSVNAALIKPFESDGCSLFPDGSLLTQNVWCECCVQHDIAYWQGGAELKKIQADKALKKCIQEKTGNDLLAEAMYQGVKLGGHPIFPNWYRWGYGWPYGRAFQSLSDEEQRQVDLQLRFVDTSCPD